MPPIENYKIKILVVQEGDITIKKVNMYCNQEALKPPC